ncbi:MAG TPA: hypothetical protein VFN48_11540 [Solirubrobacteraceae bacterium]|nr:hypothetical protein [Solirubrobacteraceae bacterium]
MDRRSALIDAGIGLAVALIVLILASGPAAAGLIGVLVVLLLIAGRFLPGLWRRHHPAVLDRPLRPAGPRVEGPRPRPGRAAPARAAAVRPVRREPPTPASGQEGREMTAAERYAARQAARQRQRQLNRRD